MNSILKAQETETGAWYCFSTLPKKERIAADSIRHRAGLDPFCPRITYYKKTRRGKVRFTEALFPGYVMVRCDLSVHLRHLLSMTGLKSLVRYGDYFPTIPDHVIVDIRNRLGGEVKPPVTVALREGDAVDILDGPFADMKALISGFIPARDRVRLLLEYLGRQLEIALPPSSVLPRETDHKEVMRAEAISGIKHSME